MRQLLFCEGASFYFIKSCHVVCDSGGAVQHRRHREVIHEVLPCSGESADGDSQQPRRRHPASAILLFLSPEQSGRETVRSMSADGPRIWNSLPTEVRLAPTIELFKPLIKT